MYACVLNFSMYVSRVFDFIVLLPIGVIKNIYILIVSITQQSLSTIESRDTMPPIMQQAKQLIYEIISQLEVCTGRAARPVSPAHGPGRADNLLISNGPGRAGPRFLCGPGRAGKFRPVHGP